MPGTVTLGISSFDQLDGKYIAYIQKIKKAQTPLYFTLQLQTNQDAHTFDQQMRTVTLWTLDTTFIQRTPMRQPAKTTDNQLLNAESFKFATPTLSKATGEPIVYITFDEEGVKRFCDITKQYKGQQLAIFINDVLKTAPTIQAEICTPPTVITGGPFTVEETKKLARELNEGAFPIKMSLESEEKVAPALGGNALQGAIIGA